MPDKNKQWMNLHAMKHKHLTMFSQSKWRQFFMMSVIVLGIAACAGPSEEMTLFNLSQMRYEQALRWQDFNTAVRFHKDADKYLNKQARQRFKQFKVTEYKVISQVMNPDMRHATQTVEIKYYNTDYQIVHGMTVRNEWEYNPKANVWYLLNPMPEFK